MNDSDGSPKAAPERYPSLAAFYNCDPDRLASRELDVGLWWREESDGPLHRAAWVNDTGELYLVRLGPASLGGGTVEVLARVADSEQLERLMVGWREHCGEPSSLSWLRERAASIGRRARAGRLRVAAGMAAAPALLLAGAAAAALAV
jgi:hypothetical protein